MNPGTDYIGVTTPFYCTDGQGNFLFHKRSARCRDEQGKWDLGSGQLEFGQDVNESVLREVAEEYGCKGEILEQLPAHSIHRDNDGKRTHWVAVPFVVKIDPKEVKNNDHDKIDELKWATLDDIPQPAHTGMTFTFAHYGKYLEKYRKRS